MIVELREQIDFYSGSLNVLHKGQTFTVDIDDLKADYIFDSLPKIRFEELADFPKNYWIRSRQLQWKGFSSNEELLQTNQYLDKILRNKIFFIDDSIYETKERFYILAGEPFAFGLDVDIDVRAKRNILYNLVLQAAKDTNCRILLAKIIETHAGKSKALLEYNKEQGRFVVVNKDISLGEMKKYFESL